MNEAVSADEAGPLLVYPLYASYGDNESGDLGKSNRRCCTGTGAGTGTTGACWYASTAVQQLCSTGIPTVFGTGINILIRRETKLLVDGGIAPNTLVTLWMDCSAVQYISIRTGVCSVPYCA